MIFLLSNFMTDDKNSDHQNFLNYKLFIFLLSCLLQGWLSEIQECAKESAIITLIGNKNDLSSERKVKYDEGRKLAEVGRYLTTKTFFAKIVDKDICLLLLACLFYLLLIFVFILIKRKYLLFIPNCSLKSFST